MMFAIIATGGKQINVEVDKEYFVEKLQGNANDKVIFDQVLMIDETVGKPLIKGAEVHATIIKQDKAKKIIVFKYKPKKNSKTKYGHRQPYTKVKITDIFLSAKDQESKAKKETSKSSTEVKKEVVKEVTTKKATNPEPKVAKTTPSSQKKVIVNNPEEVVKTTEKK